MAWIMYADDNDDKLVGTDLSYPTPDYPAPWWVDYPHNPPNPDGFNKLDIPKKREEAEKAIENGRLWRYLKDFKLYKCPNSRGRPIDTVTYTVVDSMNGSDWGITPGNQLIKNRTQIQHPSERMVFLGENPITPDSWAIPYDREGWWDAPPKYHGKGSTFSFADGHSDYWKWRDKRTMETGYTGSVQLQPGNEDLHKMQRAVWGKLGYTPSE
jgi:prepilin-type processing-associated H-X9-DG protein